MFDLSSLLGGIGSAAGNMFGGLGSALGGLTGGIGDIFQSGSDVFNNGFQSLAGFGSDSAASTLNPAITGNVVEGLTKPLEQAAETTRYFWGFT